MSEISNFLAQSENFELGLELLIKYCPDHPNRKIIEFGESSFTWQKLKAALSDQEKEEAKTPDVKAYPQDRVNSWPPRLIERYKEAILLMRRRAEQHAYLRLLIYGPRGVRKYDQKKTAQITEAIMAISEEIEMIFYAIKYFEEHGHEPPGEKPMSEEERLIYWLENQVNYTAYCRNHESRKTHEGNPLYTYRKSVIEEIKRYLCSYTAKKH